MVSTAQTFYPIKTTASGNPAAVYDDATAAGANDTTTTVTFSTTTPVYLPITPYTASAAAAGSSTSLPAANAAPTNKGWRLKAATDVASTSSALRIVPAGTWTVTVSITTGAYALLATSPSYGINVIAYRVSAAGVAGAELFRVLQPATLTQVAANTTATLTSSATGIPQITLQPGETIQFEYYLSGVATANALNQVTSNTITFITGASDFVTLPAPGLRTQYAQSFAASVTCGAALQRGLNVSKAAATLGLAAFLRQLAVFKAASNTGIAVLQRNITPGGKTAPTFATATMQKNVAPISKSGVTYEAGALQRSLAVNKAASTSVIPAFARAFLHAPFVASTSASPAFAKVVNIHKSFAATTSTSANLMLGISQAILNRFSGGGTVQQVIKRFFSVYDD